MNSSGSIGTYAIEAKCIVSEAAEAVQGEGDGTPNSVEVSPFTRVARTQFFVSSTELPVPDNADPDRDGIPTSDEPQDDLDGDGLPCWNDSDCDGDEVPDSQDPDPADPTVTGRACSLEPVAVGCCTSIVTCSGRQDYVLYAQESVEVANAATISSNARIASGPFGVHLFGHAETGTIHSSGSVFLESGARVDGDVWAYDGFSAQLGAEVTGGVTEIIAPVLPSLAAFQFSLPAATGPSMSLEPTEEDFLLPGSYPSVSVKRDATLVLSSGTYYVQDFLIDSQGTLTIDASTGPVFLYVGGSLIFRGELSAVTGPDLFIGYLGQQPVFIETDFDGTVVAPSTTLTIGPDNGPSATYVGSFFAKNVLVRPNVEIVHQPFPFPWTLGLSMPLPEPMTPSIAGAVSVTHDEGHEYCATLNVTNESYAPVSSWSVALELYGDTLTDHWNAVTSQVGSTVAFGPVGWNAMINPAQTISSQGFCVERESGSTAVAEVVDTSGTF